MKIALPVNHNNIDRAEIENKFARSLGYIIYETDDDTSRFIKNPVKEEKMGAGIAAAQMLLAEDIDKIVVAEIGNKSLKMFKSAGVKIYRVTSDIEVEEALNDLENGSLKAYEK
jgi:predicted Fe-Mo cluster-binding NifX family protein